MLKGRNNQGAAGQEPIDSRIGDPELPQGLPGFFAEQWRRPVTGAVHLNGVDRIARRGHTAHYLVLHLHDEVEIFHLSVVHDVGIIRDLAAEDVIGIESREPFLTSSLCKFTIELLTERGSVYDTPTGRAKAFFIDKVASAEDLAELPPTRLHIGSHHDPAVFGAERLIGRGIGCGTAKLRRLDRITDIRRDRRLLECDRAAQQANVDKPALSVLLPLEQATDHNQGRRHTR
jgi:hypothetical protein